MPESRTTPTAAGDAIDLNDPHRALRQLGARAHQLHAATRAADRFNAMDTAEDRNTGSWLMSTALALATELVADIDNLARALKDKPSDSALRNIVAGLRVRAHQLHASARAADHFLDQESREDQETGSWLVATALTLAHKLASEMDDGTVPARRTTARAPEVEALDPATARRAAAGSAPLRGAA